MRRVMDDQLSSSILSPDRARQEAESFYRDTERPADFQLVRLTLEYGTEKTEANAQQINIPFRSVYVMKTTHPALKINLKPITNDNHQSSIELVGKDVLDFGGRVNKAFVWWEAQSVTGGSNNPQYVYLLFSLTAEFKSGSFTSPIKGIKTDVYDQMTVAPTSVAAATATLLTSPDPSGLTQDNSWLIQWTGGDNLYVGGSGVDDGSGGGGANLGYKLEPGESFQWNNKQPLYGYSAAGGTAVVIREF